MAAPLRNVHSRCRLVFGGVPGRQFVKQFSISSVKDKGLVLGVYEPTKDNGDIILNNATQHFDKISEGKLAKLLKVSSKKLKKGQCRVFYDVLPEYTSIAVCCIGKHGLAYNDAEQLEEGLENIRAAVASAVKNLRTLGESQVDVDPCGNAEAAAEGGFLSLYEYDELKAVDKRKQNVQLSCLQDHLSNSATASALWQRGKAKAEGQNFSRHLMETPSNRLTPTIFAETVVKRFDSTKVNVLVRDKSWIEGEKMGSFLSVAQGSAEPPVFLHMEYKHPDAKQHKPVALVGKGVTFDTGGISIKPSAGMEEMRGDMGGAAVVVGTMSTVEKLQLPLHIHAFIPLTENMPGGRAIKPGDVVTARNGKTIQIDNTDAEGRLILADALNYAETVEPSLILDMATLTGAIDVALGSAATGTYSTSTSLYNTLAEAGGRTGDRVWRMPLYKHYTKQVTQSQLADVNNIGKFSRSGGSCTAAAFLKEFVTNKNWLHLDIAGVMSNKDEVPYLGKGMSGRPTRTIVEFLEQVGKNTES